jgi:hypothetical protein
LKGLSDLLSSPDPEDQRFKSYFVSVMKMFLRRHYMVELLKEDKFKMNSIRSYIDVKNKEALNCWESIRLNVV